MGLWEMITEGIIQYTGLSPTAFFTVVALMVVTYKVVSSMFVTVDDLELPKADDFAIREPVQLGDLTEEELRAYDGSDPNKPLLMSIKGQIYDVSRSRMFYGPGGPYGLFAGREASRALALLSFDPKDLNGDLEGLSASELEVLQDWEYKFMEKYVKVGQLAPYKWAVNEARDKEQEEVKHKGNDEAMEVKHEQNGEAAEVKHEGSEEAEQ